MRTCRLLEQASDLYGLNQVHYKTSLLLAEKYGVLCNNRGIMCIQDLEES